MSYAVRITHRVIQKHALCEMVRLGRTSFQMQFGTYRSDYCEVQHLAKSNVQTLLICARFTLGLNRSVVNLVTGFE